MNEPDISAGSVEPKTISVNLMDSMILRRLLSFKVSLFVYIGYIRTSIPAFVFNKNELTRDNSRCISAPMMH